MSGATLNLSPRLPKPPTGQGTWPFDVTRAIDQLYRELAARENTSHISFLFADIPTSKSAKVFGFATDTNQLFYDEDGQWWEVALVPSFATGFVALQAATPGTAQTGNFNVTGTGIVDILSATTRVNTGEVTATGTVTAHDVKVLAGANEDAFIQFDADVNWSAGYDDSVDRFVVSKNLVPGTNVYMFITADGNVAPGIASLTDTATNGFLYVPLTVSGPPTGAPTAISGFAATTVGDDDKHYWYSNGAWRTASAGASVPAAAGIVYTDAVSLLTDAGALTWTAATNRLLVSDNSGLSANSDLSVEKTTAGGDVAIRVRNASGTGTGAYFMAQVAASGDSYLWLYANTTGWVIGEDQSDTFALKIVRGDTIGTGLVGTGTVITLNRTGAPVFTVQGDAASASFSADLNNAGVVGAFTRYRRIGGNSFTVGTIGSTGLLHFTASSDGVSSGISSFTATGDFAVSSTLSATYDCDIVDSKTGDQIIAVRNTRNASSTDDAFFYAESGGTSAGDAGLLMRIGSAGNGGYWAVDNSDSDNVVAGYGIVPGTTVAIKIYQGVGHLAFPLQYRAYVTGSADQTALNVTYLVMLWNTETEDIGGLHSTSANTGRMTIPADGAGRYIVTGSAAGDTNTTGIRQLFIVKNAVTVLAQTGTPANAPALGAGFEFADNPLTVVWEGVLAAADYVELWYWQNSGGSRTIDKDFSHFAIHKLS